MSEANKATVLKINEAFASNDLETFLNECSEDITWTMIGKSSLKGKDAIREFMGKMDMDAPKINVLNNIGDGDMVACDGTMTMNNPDGTLYNGGFCDIYRFQGGKIVEMNTYVVDLKDE